MTTCPECGQAPMGEACYHLCPNSDAYYSPERERQDDAQDNGRYDDVRERFANSGENGFDDEYDHEPDEDVVPFSRTATPWEVSMFVGPSDADGRDPNVLPF